jgi:hypothetical protein
MEILNTPLAVALVLITAFGFSHRRVLFYLESSGLDDGLLYGLLGLSDKACSIAYTVWFFYCGWTSSWWIAAKLILFSILGIIPYVLLEKLFGGSSRALAKISMIGWPICFYFLITNVPKLP